jgi:heme/copper-type cytochrome/quinol oxidase subunit 3
MNDNFTPPTCDLLHAEKYLQTIIRSLLVVTANSSILLRSSYTTTNAAAAAASTNTANTAAAAVMINYTFRILLVRSGSYLSS